MCRFTLRAQGARPPLRPQPPPRLRSRCRFGSPENAPKLAAGARPVLLHVHPRRAALSSDAQLSRARRKCCRRCCVSLSWRRSRRRPRLCLSRRACSCSAAVAAVAAAAVAAVVMATSEVGSLEGGSALRTRAAIAGARCLVVFLPRTLPTFRTLPQPVGASSSTQPTPSRASAAATAAAAAATSPSPSALRVSILHRTIARRSGAASNVGRGEAAAGAAAGDDPLDAARPAPGGTAR